MKNIFYLFSRAFALCLLLGAGDLSAQFCENFNNNSVGTWTSINCVTSIENQTLRSTDSPFPSWLLNYSYNSTNIECGTVCFDYDIVDDGLPGSDSMLTIQFFLVAGTVGNSAIPESFLNAEFVLNTPITEASPSMNFCMPINQISPGDPLPGNAQGQWVMANPQLWNTLVQTFTGVGFFIDFTGTTINEDIRIDNFCYTPSPILNANFTIDTDCKSGSYIVSTEATLQGQGINHTWTLRQTSTPNVTNGGMQVGNVQTGNTVTFENLDVTSFYYIEHTITNLCGDTLILNQVVPYHEIASIFNFEDETGIVKTQFCYGEDIYLDGSATYGENAYKIYKNRRPIGSNQNFAQFHESPWYTNTQAGLINLSEVFASQNSYFEPGFEYKITLAIQNVAECVNWVVSEDTLSVVCCDDFFSANFGYELTLDKVIRVESGTHFNTYENVNATHTWTILSGPTENGPYTYLTTFSGTSFDYATAPGLHYFVIHSLKTECGEICYGNHIQVNKSGGGKEEDCELCGVIDCDFLDKICQAPTNLTANCLPSPFYPGVINQHLSWSPVAAAEGYYVDVIFNSPKCCKSEKPSVETLYEVSSSYLDLNTVPVPVGWDCISWRVGAKCEEGEIMWSEYQCFSGCNSQERATQQTSLHTATLFPNPANNEVTLRFENDFTGTLQLIDALGRTIETREVSNEPAARFSLEQLSAGIYWIIAKDELGTTPFKLMKK